MRFGVVLTTLLYAALSAKAVKLYRTGNASTAVPKLRDGDFKEPEHGIIPPSDSVGVSRSILRLGRDGIKADIHTILALL